MSTKKIEVSAILTRTPDRLAEAITPDGDMYVHHNGAWRKATHLPRGQRLGFFGDLCARYPSRVRRGIFYIEVES